MLSHKCSHVINEKIGSDSLDMQLDLVVVVFFNLAQSLEMASLALSKCILRPLKLTD